jgi:hypothetical protein
MLIQRAQEEEEQEKKLRSKYKYLQSIITDSVPPPPPPPSCQIVENSPDKVKLSNTSLITEDDDNIQIPENIKGTMIKHQKKYFYHEIKNKNLKYRTPRKNKLSISLPIT